VLVIPATATKRPSKNVSKLSVILWKTYTQQVVSRDLNIRVCTIFFPTPSNTSSTPHTVWVEQLLLKNKNHLISFVLKITNGSEEAFH